MGEQCFSWEQKVNMADINNVEDKTERTPTRKRSQS